MFIGHFAPALAAATLKDAPRLPVLFVAAQLVDWAFFALLLTGAEAMRLTPGISVMNPMDLYHMPYTHSLLGALAFGGGTTIVVWLLARGNGNTIVVWPRRAQDGNGNTIVIWPRKAQDGNGNSIVVWPRAMATGIIAGAVVLSHWFLDFLVHVPDLTLAGSEPKLGLGLWNHPYLEMPLELVLTFGTLWLYARAQKPPLVPLLVLGGTMLALQSFNWFGPVDTEVTTATSMLAFSAYGLMTLCAWWLERRAAKQ